MATGSFLEEITRVTAKMYFPTDGQFSSTFLAEYVYSIYEQRLTPLVGCR